jgi:putative membrane protein
MALERGCPAGGFQPRTRLYCAGHGTGAGTALVIGLLNATVGFFLKVITFPISILTLGIFLLVINGLMILLASNIVRGFHVRGFVPAFWGAVVLALLGMLIRMVTKGA